MYKNLSRFTASDLPVACRSLAHVIIVLTDDGTLSILVLNSLEVSAGVLVSNTIFELVRLRGQFSFGFRGIFRGWGIDGWSIGWGASGLSGWPWGLFVDWTPLGLCRRDRHGSDSADQNKDG